MIFKNILLTEALNITDGQSVITAIEKGMIPGVKKSVFFDGADPKKYSTVVPDMDRLVARIKQKSNANNFIQFFLFVMKKIPYYYVVRSNINNIDDWLDSVVAYFAHKGKQEFKTDEECKKKLQYYENSTMEPKEDKAFEQWINEKFASKANIKDKEKESVTVYNKDGWTVTNPLTFAAAKEAAGMNGRKAKWCTASNPSLYGTYTEQGKNKLFVIKNPSKDVMFQMDFGGSGGSANFKLENDESAYYKEVKKYDMPDDLLKVVNNGKGKSLFDVFSKIKNRDNSGPSESMSNGWTKRKLSKEEVGKIEKFKSEDREKWLEREISDDSDMLNCFEIKKGDKLFYFLNYPESSYNIIYQKVGDKLTKKSLTSLVNAKEEMVPREMIKLAVPNTSDDDFNKPKTSKGASESKHYTNLVQLSKDVPVTEFNKFKERSMAYEFNYKNFARVMEGEDTTYISVKDDSMIILRYYPSSAVRSKADTSPSPTGSYYLRNLTNNPKEIDRYKKYASFFPNAKELQEKMELCRKVSKFDFDTTTNVDRVSEERKDLGVVNTSGMIFRDRINIVKGDTKIPEQERNKVSAHSIKFNWNEIEFDGDYILPSKEIAPSWKILVKNKTLLQDLKDIKTIYK